MVKGVNFEVLFAVPPTVTEIRDIPAPLVHLCLILFQRHEREREMDGWFIAQLCVFTTLTKSIVIERHSIVKNYIYIGSNLSDNIVIWCDGVGG